MMPLSTTEPGEVHHVGDHGLFVSGLVFGVAPYSQLYLVRTLNEDGGFVWLYHTQVGTVASRKLVNLINYTLPDSAKGLDMNQGAHPMYQVWIKQ